MQRGLEIVWPQLYEAYLTLVDKSVSWKRTNSQPTLKPLLCIHLIEQFEMRKEKKNQWVFVYSFTCKVIINKSLPHIHDNDGVPNEGRLMLERRKQRLSTEMVVDWWKCIYYDFIRPINYEHTNSFLNLIIISAIEFANY